MTDADERKQLEAGKANWLEPYNVDDAIAEVQRLAKGLIEATKHSKYHFRAEWVRQLVARYRRLPGKAVIHLDDLGDGVIPTLSTDVRALLLPSWEKLVQSFGAEWGTNHFRCIRDISVGRRNSSWSSLRVWRACKTHQDSVFPIPLFSYASWWT